MMEKSSRNSSKTRVYPAFNAIMEEHKLREFFEFLNAGQSRCAIDLEGVCWECAEVRFANKEGKGEKSLEPSRDLLYWLVLNAGKNDQIKTFVTDPKLSDQTNESRQKLFEGCQLYRERALRLLSEGCSRGWPVLEGYSRPDVFVETNKFFCVIEGKRTEKKPTEKTSYLKDRDQLLRHMDAALELAGDRPVYGVTIYENGLGFAPGCFNEKSLPHRSSTVREKLKRGYLNPRTWQELRCYFLEKHKLDLGYVDEVLN